MLTEKRTEPATVHREIMYWGKDTRRVHVEVEPRGAVKPEHCIMLSAMLSTWLCMSRSLTYCLKANIEQRHAGCIKAESSKIICDRNSC